MSRIRSSKSRDKRWLQFMCTITAEWSRAVREHRPHSVVFRELSERINALDVIPSYRADLSARNWAARDLVEALHAEWCLYLDGKRTTSAECFALGRTRDLCGRFEWRGTGIPFYDDKDPQPLETTPTLPQPQQPDGV